MPTVLQCDKHDDTIMWCTVLHGTVRYYTVQYHAALYYAAFYYHQLFCTWTYGMRGLGSKESVWGSTVAQAMENFIGARF